jgi:RNA polymerase-associated protein LEO1
MSTRELFGDDSSSEEEEEKQEEPPKKPSIYDDDDDDDDDDAVFDDGAVVGLKSTTLAGSKAAEETKEEPEEEEVLVDPRSLLVQQINSRPSDAHELFMTKLPNLVGLQTQAFDNDTFSPEQEEEEFGPQSAYNLMRWRYNAAGDKRESNTRLVQWDNGSWTLHVGKEAFEVDCIDSSDANGFAGMNGYLYLSQKAAFVKTDEDDETVKTTTPAGTVLECLGPMKSRMIVRPSSLQSDAHKSLTVAVRSKTTKRARIAQFMTTEDPEKLKEERIKVKEDLDKVAQRKKGRSSGGGGGGARRPRMSRSYLDEEEDDRDFDTTNIKAMKRGAYDREHPDYEDDYANYEEEEDEEDDTFQPRSKRPKEGDKKSRANDKDDDDDDDDEVVFGGGDDDDDDVAPVVKASKKRPTQSLFDDDSD